MRKVASNRRALMIVGAFPPRDNPIFGGIVTSCGLLLASSLPSRVPLELLDSTQVSNPPPGLLKRAVLACARSLKFIWKVESTKPEVLLIFCSSGASAVEKSAMAWYGRIRGIPSMLFPRGGALMEKGENSPALRFLLRRMFAGATMFLCQGPAWQRFATKVLGFNLSSTSIVPNWSATPQLLAIGSKRGPVRAEPVTLIFVGWVEVEKGVLELMDAFAEVSQTYECRLQVVGGGNALAAMVERAEKMGVSHLVSFRGWLQGEELVTAYALADVLVLPSWAEGLPNAMIEGMAAKLAVIVTSVGNVPQFVNDGEHALLISPRDTAGLVRAIERVLSDAELRSVISEGGYELARREFSLEPAVDRILDAMERTKARLA
jgi:glycosyltransferase involved in cell wall biosynthesis